jgi:hypothetical protein
MAKGWRVTIFDSSAYHIIKPFYKRLCIQSLEAFSLEVSMKIIRLGGGERLKICARAIEEQSYGRALPCESLIILPIPTTRDGVTICGCGSPLRDLFSFVYRGVAVAGYGIPQAVKDHMSSLGAGVYDAAEDEDFLMENARITAHGALGRIMTETDRDISELSVGVIGYGRIGSNLSELLLFLGARVRIFSGSENKIIELAAQGADACGVDSGSFSDLDILVNTAPKKILSEKMESELLSSGIRIIELASGKNFSSDEVIVMSSIPDRMYPISSGRMYAKYIIRAIEAMG